MKDTLSANQKSCLYKSVNQKPKQVGQVMIVANLDIAGNPDLIDALTHASTNTSLKYSNGVNHRVIHKANSANVNVFILL